MIAAVVACFGLLLVAVVITKYLALLDHREERELRRWHEVEQRKTQRTADVVSIAEKASDVEAALLKHEERLSQVEMTLAGGVARRRP